MQLADPDHAHQDFFSSAGLVIGLNRDDEAPWANWGKGDVKGLTIEKLASTLKPYGLKSRRLTTEEGRKIGKGYDRTALESVFEQYLEKRGVLPKNDPQPCHETRQSSPRAVSQMAESQNQPCHEGGDGRVVKSTLPSADQVPERNGRVDGRDDSVFSPKPIVFSDFDHSDPESRIQRKPDSTSSNGISGMESEPVLESGLTEEQRKAVRKWMSEFHAMLDNEKRRAETHRWLTEDWLPKHPNTKHTIYECSDDGKQYDLVGVRNLLTRLQEEKRAKDTT